MKKINSSWHNQLVKSVLTDPESRHAYETFKRELDASLLPKKKKLSSSKNKNT